MKRPKYPFEMNSAGDKLMTLALLFALVFIGLGVWAWIA
jgi:hypothetical protein